MKIALLVFQKIEKRIAPIEDLLMRGILLLFQWYLLLWE